MTTWLEIKRRAHEAGVRDNDDLGRGAVFIRPLDALVLSLLVVVLALGIWLAAAYASSVEPCAAEDVRWPLHPTRLHEWR